MKAKEFWELLCEELNYRFFTGVPSLELKSIYEKMSSRLMYYVPATRENVALGMASGVALSGISSAVFIDADRAHNLMDWLNSFNLEYKVPILIIVSEHSEDSIAKKLFSMYKVPYRTLKNAGDIRQITNKIKKSNRPGILIVEEGVVKK